MRKNVIFIIIISVIIGISYVIYEISSFSLFETEVVKLKEITIPNKSYKLGLYYVPSNATIENCIQIKELQNGNETMLQYYERYNYVNGYKFINDTLFLFLSDTSLINFKTDTLKMKLHN